MARKYLAGMILGTIKCLWKGKSKKRKMLSIVNRLYKTDLIGIRRAITIGKAICTYGDPKKPKKHKIASWAIWMNVK